MALIQHRTIAIALAPDNGREDGTDARVWTDVEPPAVPGDDVAIEREAWPEWLADLARRGELAKRSNGLRVEFRSAWLHGHDLVVGHLENLAGVSVRSAVHGPRATGYGLPPTGYSSPVAC